MGKYQFIDRFFDSQYELVDLTKPERRDFNTLYTFLNSLHTVADRLKAEFDCDITIHPEFKILRLIRNYFHHVGDVEDVRMEVCVEGNILVGHSEHIIIPLETFAKSVKSFIDKNSLPPNSKHQARKKKFVESEIAAIAEIFDGTSDLLKYLNNLCSKPSLRLDGEVYELGFDIFKFVFNITNIIADKCREIDLLKGKEVVAALDRSYTSKNNIGKYDVYCHPSSVPITTTKGFVFPKVISSAL